MPSAIIPIATYTTVGTVNTVVFSAIPGTYRDLVVVVRGSMTSSGSSIAIRSGSMSFWRQGVVAVFGGTSPTGVTNLNAQLYSQTSVSPTAFGLEAHLFDYAQTNKFKAVTMQDMGGTTYAAMTTGWGDTTSAITAVTLQSYGGSTIAAGTNFSLYGVTA
jgi:hypothetical protein